MSPLAANNNNNPLHPLWFANWPLTQLSCRIYEEEEIYSAVDARTESLQNLRELGPPDLVYLVKQPKTNSTRQVRVCKV